MNTAIASTNVRNFQRGGVRTATLQHDDWEELWVTATPMPNESFTRTIARAVDALAEEEATAINLHGFGTPISGGNLESWIRRTFRADFPVTWISQREGTGLGGVFVHAVRGIDSQPIRIGGRTVGCLIEDHSARWAYLGGLLPEHPTATAAAQTAEVLRSIDRALASVNLTFGDVLRTRFYLDDILGWYGDFNRVRTEFFREHRVFEGLLPASTGIGAANPSGSALVAALVAVRANESAPVVSRTIASPLQRSAEEYGSSFSRAVETCAPGLRRLMISGTAAIDPAGKTMFLDDPAGQIRQTMEVTEAILKSRGFTWADVVRGIAYFPDAALVPAYWDYARNVHLPELPLIMAEGVVCRDDLLFEIEVDAVRST